MCFVGQGDAEDLENFIDASLQFHIMLHYCHQAVSNYGTIDLYAYSVFWCSPKLLNFEVLFYPFEEQLNTPSVSIKQWYQFRRWVKTVRQEDVPCTVFWVFNDEFSKLLGAVLGTFINRKASDYIRNYTCGQSSFPGFGLNPYVIFGSYNEESAYAIYRIKVTEIVISTVEYVMRSGFVWNLRHSLWVVDIGRCNMQNAGTSASTS